MSFATKDKLLATLFSKRISVAVYSRWKFLPHLFVLEKEQTLVFHAHGKTLTAMELVLCVRKSVVSCHSFSWSVHIIGVEFQCLLDAV